MDVMVVKEKKLRILDDEEWREIPSSRGRYQISSYGRIKSFAVKREKGQIMKCSVIKNFKYVVLTNGNRKIHYFIHKLVAQAWHQRPSEKHTIVTHLDRNLNNNHYLNLAWVTPEEANKRNGEYFKKKFSGVKHPGERHHTKLKERDIVQLKKMLAQGVTQNKIAKMFCISEMQVTRIKRGENWGDVKWLETKP
jgi:hypothetical protein